MDDQHRQAIVKLRVIGDGLEAPSAQPESKDSTLNALFSTNKVLNWAYDPLSLIKIWESASALNQNIEAYITNIESTGYQLKAVFDFESKDIKEKVREALWAHSINDPLPDSSLDAMPELPGDEAVEVALQKLQRRARFEKLLFTSFLKNVNPSGTFMTLRRDKRSDEEILGNAFWEVTRDQSGRLARFSHVVAETIKVTAADPNPTEIEVKVAQTPLAYEKVTQYRYFRRYVQLVDQKMTWFKAMGDPRVISRATGTIFLNKETFDAWAVENKPGDVPANELIHFKVGRPGTPYGTPRWMGNLLSVLGSRACDEVNYDYFDNKTVPPMALLISGGRLGEDDVGRIQNFIQDNIKGRSNFHKILLIEAQADSDGSMVGTSVPPKIEFKQLTASQQGDALFQKYDERNMDKVSSSFRMPRLMRGDVKDFNRACYDEQTETLTARGWKRLSEFADGEWVAAYNPDSGNMEFVQPDALLVYDVDEELLHFKTNCSDIMVTENHKMLVKGATGKAGFTSHRADEIPWGRYFLKICVAGSVGDHYPDFNLPKTKGCVIERGHDHASTVDGGVFLAFLGYWLSEGSLLQTDHPSSPYLVTLSQKAGAQADAMRGCLEATGWAFSEAYEEATDMYRWVLSNRCLREWLLDNCGGKAAGKRLPAFALSLEPAQTRILFDALMLGDGHWDPRPDRSSGFYPSVSKALCDGVQILALRLGYRATLGMHYPASGNRQTCWRVLLSSGRDASYHAPPERVHYQGKVYCFSVKDHGFFVTRRNGKVAVQGNTAMASMRFAEEQVFEPERREFDDVFNSAVLPELGILMWTFKSLPTRSRDPELISKIVGEQTRAGNIRPNEARDLLEEPLGTNLPPVDEDWGKQPLQVTLAQIGADRMRGGGAIQGPPAAGKPKPGQKPEDEQQKPQPKKPPPKKPDQAVTNAVSSRETQ